MIRLALLPQAVFALSLLATYLVHSTLWYVVAWAVTRPRLGLSSGARCRVWRAALVGPLAGTALALALADVWQVPALELALTPPAVTAQNAPAVLDIERLSPPPPGAVLAGPDLLEPTVGAAPAARPLPSVDLGLLLLAAIGAAAGCRLVLLGSRQLRFWRRLRHRRPVFSGSACERLRQLAARADLPFPARLSLSPLARGPMALGRGEICLPPRALDELPGAALSAVLAHELAHLERRDNGWLTAGAMVEAVLFFQPFTRLVRREMSADAELACDERAVELTGSPVALARSIAIVAGWQLGRAEAVPVAAMARTPLDGDVVVRVKRLLSDAAAGPGAPAGRARLVVAALAGCGLLAPAIGGPAELQAASLVPMPLPKATQAANRFLDPPPEPGWQQDDRLEDDRGDRPRRKRMRAMRAPRPPAPPRPPHPAMPPLPPIPPLPPSVANIGPVAAKIAGLGMELAELHASRAGEAFTDAEQAKMKGIEKQMAGLRRQLEAEQERFSREMEAWGKQFEQQFGKEYQRRMGDWGRQYGKQMEDWTRRYGRDRERWGRDVDRRMWDLQRRQAERMQRRQEMLQRNQEMRQRAEEHRRRAEEHRRRAEENRQRAEENRRRLQRGEGR